MGNVSDRSFRENQNTFLCSVTLLFFENLAFLLDNVEKFSTAGQAIDDNAAHAHCVLDAYGYIYSEYVTLIAFPLQHGLHEHASVVRYTYVACLVCRTFLSPLSLYNASSFLHTIGPTDLLHPLPAPHFKILQAFLIYFSK
jgi:hypothetical protein